jgi:TRAP-type C4-dicarboxylate transport system permease small subunit
MVKGLTGKLKKVLVFYEKLLKPVIIGIYIAMTGIIIYAVFMRYVMNNAPSWSEELTRYLMVWGALIGMGVAARRGKHIGLSDIIKRIWGKFTPSVLFIADIMIFIFWIVVLVTGVTMTQFVAAQRSPSMNMPMWIGYLAVPVGAFFFLIEELYQIFKKLAHDTGTEEDQ